VDLRSPSISIKQSEGEFHPFISIHTQTHLGKNVERLFICFRIAIDYIKSLFIFEIERYIAYVVAGSVLLVQYEKSLQNEPTTHFVL
jgi:hypothetical protein